MEALLVDPATIDEIGVEETVNYLIESFDAIAAARFPGGSKESKPYEDFIASLGEIEPRAIEGCVVLWPGRGDWARRVVVLAARDRLNRAAVIWRVRAGGSAEKGASPDSSTGPVMESPAVADTQRPVGASDPREERRALRDQYKRECKAAKVRVTHTMIAKAANPRWNDRTLVDKWLRCVPRGHLPTTSSFGACFKTSLTCPKNNSTFPRFRPCFPHCGLLEHEQYETPKRKERQR
jgi:hypothetical protein